MTSRLVECVPNFSEGRDKTIIDRIIQPILDNEGVTLLDIDMGADFNRTVVTMVGEPESVLKTVIQCTSIALELIDMSTHSGEHARMGAVDVVPFIPISNVTMADCVDLSQRYGKTISSKHNLPIYLYAESAISPQRVRLPDIRKGEYEGFEEKLSQPEWKPDFGPSQFMPKMGVTATGGRNLLIAYNVNLNTDNKSQANQIAGKIRTSGYVIKDDEGNSIQDENGKPLRQPGIFSNLQAAGWMYDENTAQVSMNLLDFTLTGLHQVTDAIKLEAKKLGLEAVSSELVGLVPLDAILAAGQHYGNNPDASEKELVDYAINGLMLNKLSDFDPNKNIIEWAIRGD
tara:strand:+ start:5752 stop:6783 length:1032 start_codon:yes stop_codon:yes gene_type:complete